MRAGLRAVVVSVTAFAVVKVDVGAYTIIHPHVRQPLPDRKDVGLPWKETAPIEAK